MASTLKDSVVHWKRKLERVTDENAILTTIHKLSKVPITVDLLQDTGIGKIVRSLAKKSGKVGSKASSVLQNWRDVVASAQKNSVTSPKLESTKHNSNKKDSSNSEILHNEKQHKQSSSSHEKHRKSKHLSESSHKQKHVNDSSKYSTANIPHILNNHSYINRKEHENASNSNSSNRDTNGDIDEVEESYIFQESSRKRKAVEIQSLKNGKSDVKKCRKEYYQTSNKLPSIKNIKKEFSPTSNGIPDVKNIKKEFSSELNGIFDINNIKIGHLTLDLYNVNPNIKNIKKEFSPAFNGIPDIKNIKKEFDIKNIKKEFDIKNIKKESDIKNIKKESNSKPPLDLKAKNIKKEFAPLSNGIPNEKKCKREEMSVIHSSLSKSELISESTYNIDKKRHKEKKSSKYSDQKVSVTALKTQNHSSEDHQSQKSDIKKNKESKKKKNTKLKTSVKIEPTEAFTASEARFEDCLSFNDIVPIKKKKTSKSASEKKEKHVAIKKETPNSPVVSKDSVSTSGSKHIKVKTEIQNLPDLLLTYAPPLNGVDILSTLPQTQPTYRPLPQRNYDCNIPSKKKVLSNEEAIKFTSSRREKTSVYSGRKNVICTGEIPTLLQSCQQVLIDNIDAIECMGGIVPYFILEPVLLRCTSQQLYTIEDFNPYLLEDTQNLWEQHCKKDFRNYKPQENETWRDLYWRASEEREKKLRNITANISASMTTKYKPGRQVKLAYVDCFVKPPRDVARKQAKNGTALPVNHPVKAGPPSKATPRPIAPVINSAASHSREIVPKKPKVAPLMAKTLKSMKQCFRR